MAQYFHVMQYTALACAKEQATVNIHIIATSKAAEKGSQTAVYAIVHQHQWQQSWVRPGVVRATQVE